MLELLFILIELPVLSALLFVLFQLFTLWLRLPGNVPLTNLLAVFSSPLLFFTPVWYSSSYAVQLLCASHYSPLDMEEFSNDTDCRILNTLPSSFCWDFSTACSIPGIPSGISSQFFANLFQPSHIPKLLPPLPWWRQHASFICF